MHNLAGILVGGRGTRMGGVAKGLLVAPSGETLIARWRRLFSEIGVTAVLVGRHEAYEDAGMESLEDEPPGIGPLGGLIALLLRANGGRAIAVACDMPYITPALLIRLVECPSTAAIVAPRRGGYWEPLFARYDAGRVLERAKARARAGAHSLQGLLEELGTEPLDLSAEENLELRDWDEPADTKV